MASTRRLLSWFFPRRSSARADGGASVDGSTNGPTGIATTVASARTGKLLGKWLPTTAGFYIVSVACHVALLALVMTYKPRWPLPPAETVAEAAEPVVDPVVEASAETPELQIIGARVLGSPRGSVMYFQPTTVTTTGSVSATATNQDDDRTSGAPGSAGPALGQSAETPEPTLAALKRAEPITSFGGAKASQRAVVAALNWLHRHQHDDGSWSLTGFSSHCQGDACTGPGSVEACGGATALALIAFFGAQHSQTAAGPYRETVARGVRWLLDHQSPIGGITTDGDFLMYGHGMATLALSQNYALTRDQRVRVAAQAAVEFIEAAQNKTTGGWDYQPGGPGNASVFAWEHIALVSAQRSGLKVDVNCLAKAQLWLQSVAAGEHGGLFCYEARRPVTPTVTAMGHVCAEFSRLPPNHPTLVEGRRYLLAHPPAMPISQDVFYAYFGTLALRKLGGAEADRWMHRVRSSLLESQNKSGCAAGSWGPDPTPAEASSGQGGRLMLTSLATQLLELEHGYLPPLAPDSPEDVRTARQGERNRRDVIEKR